jgi:hypothetical protein
MSEKPISPLRRRMLDDMTMRRFTPDTQRDYIRAVRKLAAFLGRSPDTATAEDLRAFQLHLTATGVRPPTINAIVTVLRFFGPRGYCLEAVERALSIGPVSGLAQSQDSPAMARHREGHRPRPSLSGRCEISASAPIVAGHRSGGAGPA